MTSRERVFAAIGHRKADRVPRGEIVIDDEVIRSFLGCHEVSFSERLAFARALGLDLVCLSPSLPSGNTERTLPDPSKVKWEDVEKWADETDRFIFVLLDGAFDWGIKLLGFQPFLKGLMRESSDLTDIIRDTEALNGELARRALDLGAMAVLLADDIAYQKGLLANPKLLRRSILPSLVRQTEIFTHMGIPVFFHSDGNLSDILPDLAAMGLAGLQCLETAAGMDLASVTSQYGDKLCLWGNLDPRHLTDLRTPLEIGEEVNSILSAADARGGFIFGTSSGLFKGVRPENLAAVCKALNDASHIGPDVNP